MWGRGAIALVLTGVFSLLWFQLYLPSSSEDIPSGSARIEEAIARVLGSIGISEGSTIDPFSAMGTFGTVAIAISVSLLDSSRRLESLDQARRNAITEDQRFELNRRSYTGQIVSVFEFLLAVFASSFAAVVVFCLIACGYLTLAIIGGLLTGLLLVGAWRFLLAFETLKRIQIVRPPEPLVGRLSKLSTANRWRTVCTFLWWSLIAVWIVGVAIWVHQVEAYVNPSAITVGLMLFVALAVWFSRQLGRTALYEFGITRAITVIMTALMTTFPAALLPLMILLFTDNPKVSTYAMIFSLSACSAILFIWRTLDQTAVFPRLSSVGPSLTAQLVHEEVVPSRAESNRSAWSLVASASVALIALAISSTMTLSGPPAGGYAFVAIFGIYVGLLLIVLGVRRAPISTRVAMSLLAAVVGVAVTIGLIVSAGTAANVEQQARAATAASWLIFCFLPLSTAAFTPRRRSTWQTAFIDHAHARRRARLRRTLSSCLVSVRPGDSPTALCFSAMDPTQDPVGGDLLIP